MSETFVASAAFVGQPNVGKSTLLNALVGTKIAPTTRKPQTTRRIIRGIKTVGAYQHIYFDTPGVLKKQTGLDRFMHEQIYAAIADVDQVVAIADVTASKERSIEFLSRIKELAAKDNKPFILVLNKIDMLKDKSDVLAIIAYFADALSITEIVPVSAYNSAGLDRLFEVLSKNASPREFLFHEDLFTDASEKDIVAELIREKAMLELKDELPYRVAVTIDHFDESRREDEKKPLIAIDAIIHVERDSQKAIVIGKGAHTLRAIGTRARKDIEHLLDCQVMLKIFVRVEPNWTTSAKGLRKLGF